MDGENRRTFRRICVFCGSNCGNRAVFRDAALDLGRELVKRRVDLVYGGGSVGLMGLISQTVHNGGCHVLGVIPKALVPHEISGEPVGEVRTVADMHERKAEMARESDAFIALPGGYGTMEELLEMITWSQLGIHNKTVSTVFFFSKGCSYLLLNKNNQVQRSNSKNKERTEEKHQTIGLLNVDGYYNPLLSLFDNGVEEGFIKSDARYILVSAPSAKELLMKMEQYTPSHNQVAPTKSWGLHT